MNNKKEIKEFRMRYITVIAIIFIAVVVLIGKVVFSINSKEEVPEIITKSTLERIINVSNLSTFEAVYNGVAEVMNEKKPDKVDYYVSYDAKVKAGFDIEKVELDVDNEKKFITVVIPEIKITDTNVDITSLDYIFVNDKANKSTVSEQAYKKCIEDVKNESDSETAIYKLAGQNAKNVIKALVHPFVEQLDDDYELIIKIREVDDDEENN